MRLCTRGHRCDLQVDINIKSPITVQHYTESCIREALDLIRSHAVKWSVSTHRYRRILMGDFFFGWVTTA